MHWGVVFTGLLVLTEVESVRRLDLVLPVAGLVVGLDLSLIVLRHLGINLLLMYLLLLLSMFKLARLELMYPHIMSLQFKYPMSVWILLIAAKDVLKLLVK